MNAPALSAAIRAAREARGLTRAALGARLGISGARVQQYEINNKGICAATWREIRHALRIHAFGVGEVYSAFTPSKRLALPKPGYPVKVICADTGNILHIDYPSHDGSTVRNKSRQWDLAL